MGLPNIVLAQKDKSYQKRSLQDWRADLVVYHPILKKYKETVYFDEYLVYNQQVSNPFPKDLRLGIRFLSANNTFGYDTISYSKLDKATVFYTYKIFASDSPQAFSTTNESCVYTSKSRALSFPLSKLFAGNNSYIYFAINGFRDLLIKTKTLDDLNSDHSFRYCNRIELYFDLNVKGVSTKIKSYYFFSLKKFVEDLPE
jgi:hypothetical protein